MNTLSEFDLSDDEIDKYRWYNLLDSYFEHYFSTDDDKEDFPQSRQDMVDEIFTKMKVEKRIGHDDTKMVENIRKVLYFVASYHYKIYDEDMSDVFNLTAGSQSYQLWCKLVVCNSMFFNMVYDFVFHKKFNTWMKAAKITKVSPNSFMKNYDEEITQLFI